MKSSLIQNLLLQLYKNTSFIYIGIYGGHMATLLQKGKPPTASDLW